MTNLLYKYKYLKIAEELKKNILHGNLAGCKFLPSENSIVKRYNVNRKTVRKAIEELEKDGLVDVAANQKRRLLCGDRNGTSMCVGFIADGNISQQKISNQCGSNIFDEIVMKFQRQKVKTFKIILDSHHPEDVPGILSSPGIDIFIVMARIKPEIISNRVQKCIFLDPTIHQLDSFSIGIDCVAYGCKAYEYLYRLGHRRIGLLRYNCDYFCYDMIESGYYSAVREFKGENLRIECNHFNLNDNISDEIAEKIVGLDSLIMVSNVGGARFLRMLQKHKISVPDNLSVVAIGGYDDCDEMDPPLTCFENDYEATAKAICEYTRNVYTNTIQTPGYFSISTCRLVERKSVSAR